MQPLNSSLPIVTSLGSDSPVSADVSSIEFPSTTIPSSGTFSPAFTTIISPISTSSGDTVITSPFLNTFA